MCSLRLGKEPTIQPCTGNSGSVDRTSRTMTSQAVQGWAPSAQTFVPARVAAAKAAPVMAFVWLTRVRRSKVPLKPPARPGRARPVHARRASPARRRRARRRRRVRQIPGGRLRSRGPGGAGCGPRRPGMPDEAGHGGGSPFAAGETQYLPVEGRLAETGTPRSRRRCRPGRRAGRRSARRRRSGSRRRCRR